MSKYKAKLYFCTGTSLHQCHHPPPQATKEMQCLQLGPLNDTSSRCHQQLSLPQWCQQDRTFGCLVAAQHTAIPQQLAAVHRKGLYPLPSATGRLVLPNGCSKVPLSCSRLLPGPPHTPVWRELENWTFSFQKFNTKEDALNLHSFHLCCPTLILHWRITKFQVQHVYVIAELENLLLGNSNLQI